MSRTDRVHVYLELARAAIEKSVATHGHTFPNLREIADSLGLDVNFLGWAWREVWHEYDDDSRLDPDAVVF